MIPPVPVPAPAKTLALEILVFCNKQVPRLLGFPFVKLSTPLCSIFDLTNNNGILAGTIRPTIASTSLLPSNVCLVT